MPEAAPRPDDEARDAHGALPMLRRRRCSSATLSSMDPCVTRRQNVVIAGLPTLKQHASTALSACKRAAGSDCGPGADDSTARALARLP